MSNTSLQIATEQFGVIRDQFSFENKPLTVVTINDEPWFLTRELEAFLKLERLSNALSRLKDDERIIVTESNKEKIIQHFENTEENFNIRLGQTVLVSESGLYELCFSGRTEGAIAFRRWVTSEVLPSIRKTGKYELPQAQTQSKYIARLESRIEELHGTSTYLLEQVDQIYDGMQMLAHQGTRAGRTPGSRPQSAKDIAKGRILDGYYDAILNQRNAALAIQYDLVESFLNEFPSDEPSQPEDVLMKQYIYPLIKARRNFLKTRFSFISQ